MLLEPAFKHGKDPGDRVLYGDFGVLITGDGTGIH